MKRRRKTDLDIPTVLNVDERRVVDDGEAEEEDISLGVREGADASITLLTGGIPKGELDLLTLDDDGGLVVIEDGGDVLLGELSLCVRDQHAFGTSKTSHKKKKKRAEKTKRKETT